jgi:thiol-disulfide isomerase/thioredoxin
LALCLLAAAAFGPGQAWAQGCIVARLSAPTLGGAQGPYLSPNEWQIFASYRMLKADTHFAGIKELISRQLLRNNVINQQQILDIGVTRQMTNRLSLSLAVPILTDGSWSVPVPVFPPGERQTQHANGLGDVSLTVRYWILDPERHPKGNFELGGGIKFPTGDDNAKSRFSDATGRVFSKMPVDQSIQPGDGGWGFNLDFQGFQQVGKATLFASVTYLVNPRNTNDTESSVLFLCGGVIPPNLKQFKFNSVPDQYLARAGVAYPIPGVKGLSVSLAARMEGVPVRDLVGGNEGFRRPGYAIFLEPGISYTRGPHTFSFSAPVAVQRNLQQVVGGYQPDGTFADHILLMGYSYRFGGSRKKAMDHGHMTPTETQKAPPNAETLYDEKADGKKQIAEAVRQARASGKRVLLHFGANWCGPCHVLHGLMTKDPELAALVEKGYVVANIDQNEDHNAGLRGKYGRKGQETIPFVVILDENGKRLDAPDMESLGAKAPLSGYDRDKLAELLTKWLPEAKAR